MRGRLGGIGGLDWTASWAGPTPVPVLNDAQAALLGEAWLGAAAGCRNVALLTLGTGVGGAAMVDGRLLRGHLGRAGHLGHVCLDPAGRPTSSARRAAWRTRSATAPSHAPHGRAVPSTLALAAAAAGGDKDAAAVWAAPSAPWPAAIASLINVLDPEVFIIGGGIAAAGDALFGPLRAELDGIEWRPHGRQVRVVPAPASRAGRSYAGAQVEPPNRNPKQAEMRSAGEGPS